MSKITVEIEDTLDDCVESAIDNVKDELLNYLEENEPDKLPCINNDLNYSGVVHEIIDNAVPIHTREINDIFYLHGNEVEQAFDDAGIGHKEDAGFPQGWKPAAIYCYIESKVQEWYHDHAEEVFEQWQAEHREKKLENVEVFHVSADDFLAAAEGTWQADRMAETVKDYLVGEYDQAEVEPAEEEAAKELEGFYWWSCSPGCLPDSDAAGPFETREEAEEDAIG